MAVPRSSTPSTSPSSSGWRAPLQRALLSHAAKPVVWLLWLAPLAWLVWAVLSDNLGANPAEALIRGTGDWALRALWLALAVTPLRQSLQLTALARLRRLLGLFAFFYAVLHLVCYAWLDQGWAWADMAADVLRRPFILVGMLTFLLLLMLAATSLHAVLRWLGGARWKRLHRAVYAAALLALLHFYWMRSGKNDQAEVAVYATLLVLLLGARWRRRAGR
ncbi:MAG: ferric reductase-like transmembrane domain-containing protein [Acidovorax sp.]|jgi:sulfoxide reductase heme-binding subunit YedZ|nr:ferric reductase-like transmembrane domain-containing protein [Acidovorax sp.]